MSTIEELIKLQNYNVIEARPLTVRGQYSKNTNVDLNKTIQSVSLLTQELNNFNSSAPESSLNTGAIFSMKQWVNDTSAALLQQLLPSVQTLTSNQKPLTKKIVLTNTIITAAIQSALNQQDVILDKLEDQVFRVLEKQNNVKVVKDDNGNVTIVPILTENAQKSLDNVTKLLSSMTTTLDKINTRISNEKPIKNVDDFVNNLSLEHVIEFAEKLIAVVTIALQIKITIRKIKDLAASTNSAALGDVASSIVFAENATKYTADEERLISDLSAAQITIGVVKGQILFYQNILQEIIDKLKELLEIIKSVQIQSNTSNTQTQELIDKIDKITNEQQQVQDKLTKKLLESEFIQIPKPNYAARIIR